MARDFNQSNPAFEGNVTSGDEAAHSSLVKSVAPEVHAQSDDDIQDVPPPQDPNISGATVTKDVYPWRAGQISAWQENDDYRRFFEAGYVGESATTHRHDTVHDGDYDDNRGIPLAIGETHGVAGEPTDRNTHHGTLPTADEFPLGPVIRRRI